MNNTLQIRYIKHADINKPLWDRRIRNAANSRIYALSGWLDIVSPGWSALVTDNYDFVMPLPEKQKFGIKYIAQPKFTQQTGVFSSLKITNNIILNFLKLIPERYKYQIVHLNSQNKISGENITKKPNHLLCLNSKLEDLYKAFSQNTKRNIKKSEKFENITDKNISVDEAVFLKKDNNINALSDKDLKILRRLILFAKEQHNVKIYGVRNINKRLISVTVFVFCGNRIYLPLIASSPEGKKKFASFQIFNTFIEEYAGNELILDFEGSSVPGVARFFEGWGAASEIYYIYRQNNLPMFFKIFKK